MLPTHFHDFEIENMKRNQYLKKAYNKSKDGHLIWGSSEDNLNITCVREFGV